MLATIESQLSIMEPYVQWGFAGFCFVIFAVLMFVIVWLVGKLLLILKETNQVIAGNTTAINAVHTTADETKILMGDIRDQLLLRPCLAGAILQKDTARKAALALEHVADRAAEALDHVAAEAADALKLKATGDRMGESEKK